MKSIIKGLVICIIILIILISLLFQVKANIQKSASEYQAIISEESMNMHTYTYPYRNTEAEVFAIDIYEDREIKLHYWRKDFLGNIAVKIADEENDKLIDEFLVSRGYTSKSIKLKKGKYTVSTKINSLMGGFIIAYGSTLSDLKTQVDTDDDGLPDRDEISYGTDRNSEDTDGDGLSDYLEVVKYKTNPAALDSDGDGVMDGNWEERREYVYTVQAIVDLRVPYDINDMNDSFQDARIIRDDNKDAARVEVVLYPETSLIINPSQYKYKETSNEYSVPTFTKNYSGRMRDEVIKLVDGKETDIQVVMKLIGELRKAKGMDLVKDLKMDSDMPLDFALVKSRNGIIVTPERKSSAFSMDEVQKKVLFADSMFENKTRGACGSTAIFRGGLMRSAGLQERSIFTIPLFYSLKSDNTVYKINDNYVDKEFIGLPDEGDSYWVDYVLNEVYIRNQWIQVDFGIRGSFGSFDNPWYIKTICFNDPSEVDFYNKYSRLDFFSERPYKYISVIEQEKKY